MMAITGLQMASPAAASVEINANPTGEEPLLQYTAAGHALAFGREGVIIASATHMVHITFSGSNSVMPLSENRPGDSSSQVSEFQRVIYENLWDGVTLEYIAVDEGILKSVYYLNHGKTVENIRLRYNRPVRLDEEGNLCLVFDTGVMQEAAPVAWQELDNQRIGVTVNWHLYNEFEAGFSLGDYTPDMPVVIDPWLTFLGGSGTDYGHSITTDSAGNIFVCGYSTGAWGSPVRAYASGADVFIAKMSNNGTLQWLTFLGGGGTDYGQAIALDNAGNVYVTGYSSATWGSPVRAYTASNDAFAAALNVDGVLQWHTFLGGSGADIGYGIAVDSISNIYITGSSAASWGSPVRAYTAGNDAFAAALNSSGALQWHTFLGGGGTDISYGITVDSASNLFIAGYSTATWGSPVRVYTSGDDAFIVKLNSAGVLQWNTFLGGSGADRGQGIAVDSGGSIYITGYSAATWGSPVRAYTAGNDAFAAALNSSGALQWHTFLGGSGTDIAYGITLDTNSNVSITGYSSVTWGTPVRGFTSGNDGFIVRLNSSGILIWNSFLGGTGTDISYALALDGNGNTFISGYCTATWGSPLRAYTGGSDVLVSAVNSSGNLLWNTFLGGGETEIAQGITTDNSGNIYITGYGISNWGSPIRVYSGGADAFIAKLSTSGSLLWHTFLGGSGNDYGQSIALDSAGNIYIAGYSSATWGTPIRNYSASNDAFIARINPAGVLQWHTFLGGNGADIAYGIVVDSNANLLISGYSSATWGSPVRAYTASNDAFSARLNSEGVLQWHTFLGGSGTDYGFAVALDSGGNIYITGYSTATWGSPVRAYTSGDDAFIVKLNSAGVLQWSTFLGGSGADRGQGIAVDSGGSIYVTGYSAATWGSPVRAYTASNDAFAAALNSSGALQWHTFLGGNGSDIGYAIAIDINDNLYISGSSAATWGTPGRAFTGGTDAFVTKLNNLNGALHWLSFLGGSGTDITYAIALDTSLNIYVAGYSSASWGTPIRTFLGGTDGLVVQIDSNGYLTATPEITVSGNSIEIASGKMAPLAADGTDFGPVLFPGGSVSRTFTIHNIGSANLNLTGNPRVAISGVHSSDFSVVAQPATPVAAGNTANFQIAFQPLEIGLRTAVISIACNDPDENPYTFAIQGRGVAILTVNGITASHKVYDGTVSATLNTAGAALTGVREGHSVNLDTAGATASFIDKNTGTNKAVTISGLFLTGADAVNYSLVQPSTEADISPRPITVGAVADSKTYDGTTASDRTPTITSGSLAEGDSALWSQSFDNKQAGDNKTISPAGSVNDGNSGLNYSIAFVPVNSGSITPRPLTLSATALNKEYDGTPSASVSFSYDRLAGDSFNIIYTAATFTDKNAGTNKTVTISGIALNGPDAVNYSYNDTLATLADISPRPITVGAIADSKTYDGTTASDRTPTITSGSLAEGDSALWSQSFDNKQAGDNKTISPAGSVNDGNSGLNYSIAFVPVNSGSITPRPLTIKGLTAVNKSFDGTNTAVINAGLAVLEGIYSGDTLILDTSNMLAVFENPAPGPDKTITINGLIIAGPDACNYLLDLPQLTAAITAPVIVIEGNNRKITRGSSTPAENNLTDFGSSPVSGTAKEHTFILKNTGTENLAMAGKPIVQVSGPAAADFSITRLPDQNIAPGESTYFKIAFVPKAAGLRTATIIIFSSDPFNNPFNFAIRGTGTILPPTQPAPAPVFSPFSEPEPDTEPLPTVIVIESSRSSAGVITPHKNTITVENSFNKFENDTILVVTFPEATSSETSALYLAKDPGVSLQNNRLVIPASKVTSSGKPVLGFSDEKGEIKAQVVITTGLTSSQRDKTRLEAISITAITDYTVKNLSGANSALGEVASAIQFDLVTLPPGGGIKIATQARPDPETEAAFRLAAKRVGLEDISIAYVISVDKINLQNGQDIKSASILMKVNRQWVEANGGPEAVRIVRYDPSTHIYQLLETSFMGFDKQGRTIFEGFSPRGLSFFGLISIESNAGQIPAQSTSSPASIFGKGLNDQNKEIGQPGETGAIRTLKTCKFALQIIIVLCMACLIFLVQRRIEIKNTLQFD